MEPPIGHAGIRWREAAIVAGLLAAAGLVRAAYLLGYLVDVPFATAPIADSAYYDAWARRVVAGEGYGPAPFYMAPLYPYLLAGLYTLFGRDLSLVAAIQCALGLANLLMVYRLGRGLFGHAAGLAALLLAALYAPLMFLETKLLTETVAITLNLASVLLLARGVLRTEPVARSWMRPTLWWGIAGLAIGLSVLARPSSLAYAGLVFAWAVWRAVRHREGTRWIHVAVLGGGIAAAILPVTVRNLVIGGDTALVTTNAGIVFAQGNNPDAHGIATPLPGFSNTIENQQQEEMEIASRALGRPVSPAESSAWWLARGLGTAAEHPLDFARTLGEKALWSLHAREARDVYNLDQERETLPVLDLLFLPFPVLAGLGIGGWILARRGRGTAGETTAGGMEVTALSVAASFLVLIVFSVSFRYRAPVAPVLAVFAGHAVVRAFEHARAGRWCTLATTAGFVVGVSLVSLVPYPIERITAEAPANLGAAFLADGRIDSAIEQSFVAIRLDPRHAPARYNLGLALRRAGDGPGALREFAEVVRLRPSDARARHNLATMLDEQGRLDEAIREYRETLELRPDFGRTHYNLAMALFAKGEIAGAGSEVSEARRLGVEPDPAFVAALEGVAVHPMMRDGND